MMSKMYHILSPDGQVHHINDDELYHWKYISKKKIDGKWRYYYNVSQLKDDLGFDEREAYKNAKQRYENASSQKELAVQNTKNYGRLGILKSTDGYANRKLTKYVKDSIESAHYWSSEKTKSGKEYLKAKQDYMNTPLGTALRFSESAKNTISKAKKFLSKLFG